MSAPRAFSFFVLTVYFSDVLCIQTDVSDICVLCFAFSCFVSRKISRKIFCHGAIFHHTVSEFLVQSDRVRIFGFDLRRAFRQRRKTLLQVLFRGRRDAGKFRRSRWSARPLRGSRFFAEGHSLRVRCHTSIKILRYNHPSASFRQRRGRGIHAERRVPRRARRKTPQTS